MTAFASQPSDAATGPMAQGPSAQRAQAKLRLQRPGSELVVYLREGQRLQGTLLTLDEQAFCLRDDRNGELHVDAIGRVIFTTALGVRRG